MFWTSDQSYWSSLLQTSTYSSLSAAVIDLVDMALDQIKNLLDTDVEEGSHRFTDKISLKTDFEIKTEYLLRDRHFSVIDSTMDVEVLKRIWQFNVHIRLVHFESSLENLELLHECSHRTPFRGVRANFVLLRVAV